MQQWHPLRRCGVLYNISVALWYGKMGVLYSLVSTANDIAAHVPAGLAVQFMAPHFMVPHFTAP